MPPLLYAEKCEHHIVAKEDPCVRRACVGQVWGEPWWKNRGVHVQVKCKRFMACARNKLWWMTPEWGTAMSEVPTETQFLLLQHGRKGPYTVMLPLIDRSGFRATLKADRNLCAPAVCCAEHPLFFSATRLHRTCPRCDVTRPRSRTRAACARARGVWHRPLGPVCQHRAPLQHASHRCRCV